MRYTVTVTITLRPSILDPQGKATQDALHQLGYIDVESVRIGKHIVLTVTADSEEEASTMGEACAEKLLANGVMEDYQVAVAACP